MNEQSSDLENHYNQSLPVMNALFILIETTFIPEQFIPFQIGMRQGEVEVTPFVEHDHAPYPDNDAILVDAIKLHNPLS